MLKIVIPATEVFDEKKEEFIYLDQKELVLEHSLLSITKWEEKHHKAFISKEKKSTEEMIDYIKCMTLTQNVSDDVYSRLTQDNITEIQSYINDARTSLFFDEKNNVKNVSFPNEKFYYYMISLNIPFECQKWHVNHLISLIKYINEMNKPKRKGATSDELAKRRALNEMRRAQMHSKG